MGDRTHYVHVYATVRVKVAVRAENHEDAMKMADGLLFNDGFAVRLIPAAVAVVDADYAEEVTGYLVDESGDPDFLRSRTYDPDYKPVRSSR
ncbi:hypothetical protein [Rhizorhapis sp. SPR117]|uniref:hypothetical protein n=1 Tax=Rhizorhapis sp. SPR117 TaxID=2912611 RepID=UPI001F2D8E4A|nr:hypothetical protein [Rhizorhapis sp. SPR117]